MQKAQCQLVCAHIPVRRVPVQLKKKKHWKRPPRASCARALQCATGGHARTRRSSQCEVKALNARRVGQFHWGNLNGTVRLLVPTGLFWTLLHINSDAVYEKRTVYRLESRLWIYKRKRDALGILRRVSLRLAADALELVSETQSLKRKRLIVVVFFFCRIWIATSAFYYLSLWNSPTFPAGKHFKVWIGC